MDNFPQRQQAVERFKAFLMKKSAKTNLSLYELMVSVLSKVMDERPENPVDVIENLSYEVKRDMLQNAPSTTSSEQLVEKQKSVFSHREEGDQQEMDGNTESSIRRQAAECFKAFLLKNSPKTNLNLYDHMARMLSKVMDEGLENAVDVIEDLSLNIKHNMMQANLTMLRDAPATNSSEILAEQQKALFDCKEETEQEEIMMESPLPNVTELMYFLEQIGISLGREEMNRIQLALKQLLDMHRLQHCRFWGKILGTEGSYIVAEVEFREEGVEEVNEDKEREGATSEDEPFTPVPQEPRGSGTNKFMYFVCKEPGLPWVCLPEVTPAQITIARQIRKLFTGRLDAPVVSYPPFPGNEANYLRAQIARISASTHVSPLGFYQFKEEEEEEEEEEGARDSIEENPDFEGAEVNEMAESLSMWAHHTQHILKQGRCIWINVAEKTRDMPKEDEDKEEEEEEEEKEEEPDEPEPEVGPPLLTPLSEDAEVSNIPAWSTRISSIPVSEYSIASVHSNRWPGAYAYACGMKFGNIYIGLGLKFLSEPFTPALPPSPQSEYPSGPEITEALDPSVEEEEALKEEEEEQKAMLEDNDALDAEEEEEEEEADD